MCVAVNVKHYYSKDHQSKFWSGKNLPEPRHFEMVPSSFHYSRVEPSPHHLPRSSSSKPYFLSLFRHQNSYLLFRFNFFSRILQLQPFFGSIENFIILKTKRTRSVCWRNPFINLCCLSAAIQHKKVQNEWPECVCLEQQQRKLLLGHLYSTAHPTRHLLVEKPASHECPGLY